MYIEEEEEVQVIYLSEISTYSQFESCDKFLLNLTVVSFVPLLSIRSSGHFNNFITSQYAAIWGQ